MRQQQLPSLWADRLHDRHPLHFLPMRFEAYLDKKRDRARADSTPAVRKEIAQENCVILPPVALHAPG
jgi:hypothetical protein